MPDSTAYQRILTPFAPLTDEPASLMTTTVSAPPARIGDLYLTTSAASPDEYAPADLGVCLLGPTPRIHDWHAGIEGDFAHALRTLATLARQGHDPVALLLVTRSNHHVLASVAGVAARVGVGRVLVTPGRPALDADPALDPGRHWQRVLPRFATASRSIETLMEALTNKGVVAALRGWPLCLLSEQGVARSLAGPLPEVIAAPVADAPQTPAVMPLGWTPPASPSTTTQPPAPGPARLCRDCPLYDRCGGLPEAYRALYGDAELR